MAHGRAAQLTEHTRLVRRGAVAGVIAAFCTTVIAAIASAANVSLEIDGTAIPIPAFAWWTLVGSGLGIVLARLLRKRRTFVVVSTAATGLSLIPAIAAPDNTISTAVLMVTPSSQQTSSSRSSATAQRSHHKTANRKAHPQLDTKEITIMNHHINPNRTSRRALIGLISAFVTTAGIIAVPATASARNIIHERWHDESSGSIDWCPFADDLINWSSDVNGVLTAVRRRDGIVYLTETVRGTTVYTNTETGKTFTNIFATIGRDLDIVDNGDGTLTITAQGAGSDRYLDGDGRLVMSNNGMVRWAVLIDHGGTPGDPDDDKFLENLGIVKDSTGTNDTAGRDFCDDLLTFTS